MTGFFEQNITVIISAAGLFLTWWIYRQKDVKDRSQFETGLEKRLTTMETRSEVLWTFWNELNKKTAQQLISPHTPELDVLLRKQVNDEKLSEAELRKVRNFLLAEEETAARQGDGLRRFNIMIQLSSVTAKLREYELKRKDD